MRQGYLRPSKSAIEMQESIHRMNRAGVLTKHIFIANDFTEIVEQLQPGDILVVDTIRNVCTGLNDFFNLVERLSASGVGFESADEYAIRISDGDKEAIELLKTLHRMNRGLKAYHSKQGLNRAVQNGKKLGRPTGMTEKFKKALDLYRFSDKSVTEICRSLDCDSSTLYRHIKRLGLERKPAKKKN